MSNRATRRAGPRFHSEDLVTLAATPDRVGIISRTHHDPDDDEDLDPNYDPAFNLAPDDVEISWTGNPPAAPQIYKESEVVLLDRYFLPGDIVLHPTNPTMSGTVIEVEGRADLKDVRGSATLDDVDMALLEFKYPFLSVGGILFKDGWCGRLHDVSKCKVQIMFSTGAVCEINEADLEMHAHIEFGDEHNSLSLDRVQPGLIVRVRRTFHDHVTRWLTESRSTGSGVGLIIDLHAEQLDVDWAFDTAAVNGPPLPLPDQLVDPQSVKYFRSSLEHATMFVGNLVQFRAHADTPRLADGRDATPCYRLVKTRTFATVRWQDGTVQHGMRATELKIPLAVDETALWPGDICWNRQGQLQDLEDANDLQVGVVQSVDPARRLAIVRWFDAAWDNLGVPETCSLYQISSHPNFTMDLADRVLVAAHKDSPRSYSWFGEVVRIALDGTRDVYLANGQTETHRFDQLTLVDPTEMGPLEDELGSEDGFLDEDGNMVDPSDEEWMTDDDEAAARSGSNDEDEDADEQVSRDDDAMDVDVDAATTTTGTITTAAGDGDVDVEPDLASAPAAPVIPGEEPFDVVDDDDTPLDPATLHFKDATPMTAALLRQIRKQHAALRTGLPHGIYVRTFASRLDLLVALVFGPDDTPYAGAPFLFEIQLPADYPRTPPSVYFMNRSGGRMNPNLHEDGKVCLSLLGTWHGKSYESWNPSTSTILQLLVSIQGLVLVKHPYFLEPGYGKYQGTADGAQNSRMYNERVRILSLKGTVAYLERPPAYLKSTLDAYYTRGAGKDLVDSIPKELEDPSWTEGAKVMMRPVAEKMVRKLKALAEEAAKAEEGESKEGEDARAAAADESSEQ
ncbi:hypothetical protein GGF31_007708 [Allomyces arbusculus]|nr:hypothetical protein GGF31_007708 [Allomyces arbusculus]